MRFWVVYDREMFDTMTHGGRKFVVLIYNSNKNKCRVNKKH